MEIGASSPQPRQVDAQLCRAGDRTRTHDQLSNMNPEYKVVSIAGELV